MQVKRYLPVCHCFYRQDSGFHLCGHLLCCHLLILPIFSKGFIPTQARSGLPALILPSTDKTGLGFETGNKAFFPWPLTRSRRPAKKVVSQQPTAHLQGGPPLKTYKIPVFRLQMVKEKEIEAIRIRHPEDIISFMGVDCGVKRVSALLIPAFLIFCNDEIYICYREIRETQEGFRGVFFLLDC